MSAEGGLVTRPRNIGGPWAEREECTAPTNQSYRVDLRRLRPAATTARPHQNHRIDLRQLRPAPATGPRFPLTVPGETDTTGVPRVLVAQLLLRTYYATLRSDGRYGPQTRAAVMVFQVRTHREVTGVLHPADWAALAEQQPLRIGSRGNAVRAVQTLLNHSLPTADELIVDGLLGTGTTMSLHEHQRRAGLAQTDSVTAATWMALLS